jgi:hypothetical protein
VDAKCTAIGSSAPIPPPYLNLTSALIKRSLETIAQGSLKLQHQFIEIGVVNAAVIFSAALSLSVFELPRGPLFLIRSGTGNPDLPVNRFPVVFYRFVAWWIGFCFVWLLSAYILSLPLLLVIATITRLFFTAYTTYGIVKFTYGFLLAGSVVLKIWLMILIVYSLSTLVLQYLQSILADRSG